MNAPAPRPAPPADWRALSLREKVGQTVIFETDAVREGSVGDGSLASFVERYPAAGFFLAHWKFPLSDGADRAARVQRHIDRYRRACRVPPFLQEDHEQGLGPFDEAFVHLPTLMALGAADSEALALRYGQVLAEQARAQGLNWLLNPVADLALNPLSPVTSTRAIGDDPARAVPLLQAVLRGTAQHGLISTIKHFPGDGVDHRDQHLVMPVNGLSRTHWWATYGRVYRALIDAGAPSVMVGHLALPAFQTAQADGQCQPATLSGELVTGLLKGELGFDGVVMSDALNMGGMQGWHATALDTQIAAFKAGIDLMLWPAPDFIDRLEAEVRSGGVAASRLDDAVARVWRLKQRFGLLDEASAQAPILPLTEAQRVQHEQLAQDVADRSVTLVRNRRGLLPLRAQPGLRLLLVVVGPEAQAEELSRRFEPTAAALRQRGLQVALRVNLSYYEADLGQALRDHDRFVFAFCRHPHAPIGSLQLQGSEALTVWSMQQLPPERVLAVSYGDPAVHDQYLPRLPTAVNVYSSCAASQRALVKALLGEMPFSGRSPVQLGLRPADLTAGAATVA